MRRSLLILVITLFTIIALPVNFVEAGTITSLDASSNGSRISVEGTSEEGVLAVAAFVYSGENLEYMETGACFDTQYSFELNNNFDSGDYIVKVADYEGGEYVEDEVNIAEVTEDPDPAIEEEVDDDDDKVDTGDNSNMSSWIVLLLASGMAVIAMITYFIRRARA